MKTSHLSELAAKICDDCTALYELCGQMIATMEVNLDRGYIVTRDDADFRRLIECFKTRMQNHNPERIELIPKPVPGCDCTLCRALNPALKNDRSQTV